MMGKKFLRNIIISCITLSAASLVSLSALTLGWFGGPSAQTDDAPPIDGDIGLRGYFFAGSGRDGDAYEIVSPNHFYNLTRLQNLGIFGGVNTNPQSTDGKWHFQIGHDFGHGLKCLEYDANGNQIETDYLDMEGTKVSPIGGEGTPFKGVFDGKGIPVKNLVVEGSPEDIGVFGYVSHEGVVKGLVCDNIEIRSTGYTNDNEDNRYKLFFPDVDDLFAANASGFKTASLSMLQKGVSGETNLKKLNGTNGTEILAVNSDDNIDVGTISKYSFKANYPTGRNKGPFSYTWKSSSPAIKEKSTGSNEMILDLSVLRDSNDFNSGVNKEIDARISLIATINVDGFVFSRVIQSYTLQFYSKGHGYSGWLVKERKLIKYGSGVPNVSIGQDGDYYVDVSNDTSADASLYYRQNNTWTAIPGVTHGSNTLPSRSDGSAGDYYLNIKGNNIYDVYMKESVEGYYSAAIFCDYVNDYPNDTKTNYHHGNNIGFLAGHVDGTIENSYVYNGKLTFNNAGASYRPIPTESDLGLIGEVGSHVVNAVDPLRGLTNRGDTGIINLSKIYSLIRDKNENGTDKVMTSGQSVKAGYANGHSYISYQNYLSPTYGRFANYLRQSTSYPKEFITGVGNDMSGGSPANWHNYSLPSTIPPDFNSVDFLWNCVIEDEPRSQHVEQIDASHYNLYIKENFEWGDPVDGSNIITGQLKPNGGATGAYYFNLATDTLLRKGASDWEKVDALFGKNAPSDSFGSNGDLYADIVNDKLYQRGEYVWTETGTISTGEIAPDNGVGSNGNYYIDTISLSVFLKDSGNWGILANTTHSNTIPDKSSNNTGDRGLGVFKIVSSYNEEAAIAAENDPYSYFVADLGGCRIMKGTPHTKVYFSTAEYDHTIDPTGSWSGDGPMRATTIPTSFDVNSFNWPFSRDYNYCFELDLSQVGQATSYYMSNTNSDFLANYLYNKLTNSIGGKFKPGDVEFGFDFRSSDDELLNSLSSYMPVTKPGTKNNFGTDANPRYYPSNSIVFDIDNDDGANVSIVGNNADISIYRNDPDSSTAVTKLYTMRSYPSNSTDLHRYFSYDYRSGDTGTETVKYGDLYLNTTNNKLYRKNTSGNTWNEISCTKSAGAPTGVGSDGEYYVDTNTKTVYCYSEANEKWERVSGVITGTSAPSTPAGYDMSDANNALYGHIFKLDKGHYVVGASSEGRTANIYYLAVQGQTNGTIGAKDMAGVGNAITDVDFLTQPPVFGVEHSLAQFSFKSNFNTVNGEFIIGVDTNDGNKFRILFSDATNGQFVTYLLMFSRTKVLRYYVYVDASHTSYTAESTIYPR